MIDIYFEYALYFNIAIFLCALYVVYFASCMLDAYKADNFEIQRNHNWVSTGYPRTEMNDYDGNFSVYEEFKRKYLLCGYFKKWVLVAHSVSLEDASTLSSLIEGKRKKGIVIHLPR